MEAFGGPKRVYGYQPSGMRTSRGQYADRGGEGGIRTLAPDLESVSYVFSIRLTLQKHPLRLMYYFRLLPRSEAVRVFSSKNTAPSTAQT
jgi:hypothetical protein